MPEYPALPVFVDAWLSDTHPGLSLEEQGCYWLLTQFAWLTPAKALPDDDVWIASRLAIHPLKWKHLRPRVLERFWTLETTDRGRYWYQKKLRSVADHLGERRRKAVESAAVSVSVRKSKTNNNNNLASANVSPTAQASNLIYSKSSKLTSSELDAASSAPPPNGGARSPTLPAGQVFVAIDTPPWKAWSVHLGKVPPVNRDFGWYFPTEWPPAKPNGSTHQPKTEDEEIPF